MKYFIFPVNPSSLDEMKPEITTIKKTLGGVTVLSHPGFIPVDINISGNFGRKFRVLLGEDYKEFLGGFATGGGNGLKDGLIDLFDNKVKTGYGCIKVLESIILESKKVDSVNGIRTLIFHNLALGNSYLVKPLSLRFNQSQESNMIWNYTLGMKGVAPLEALYTQEQLTEMRFRLVLTGYLQNQTNRAVNELSSYLDRAATKNEI